MYPNFRPRPMPNWPAGYQMPPQAMALSAYAPRPMPQWDPRMTAQAPLPPSLAPPPPPPSPPPTEGIAAPKDSNPSPGQPVVSPLSPSAVEAFPDSLPVPPDPPVGTALPSPTGDPVPPTPPHEKNPPHHGPRGYCFYGDVDGLLWWTKARATPVLLATGTLGANGTAVVLGNLNFDDQLRYGARGSLGTWLNQRQTFGLEVGGFWLAQRQPSATITADNLVRPFLDVTTGAESGVVLAAPGIQSGSSTVTALQRLWSAEANARVELLRACWYHLDLLAGFRYLELRDQLTIADRTTFGAGLAGLGGSTLSSTDSFSTRNQFYGGQLGLDLEMHYGRFFVNMWGKVALGPNQESVTINGSTVLRSNAGLSTTRVGGLFALPTNIGTYSREGLLVVPEFGVNFGLQLTSHLRGTVGYTFLYLDDIVLAPEQIDRGINPARRPTLAGATGTATGPTRPLFAFQSSDFWAQGFSLGLEFRY